MKIAVSSPTPISKNTSSVFAANLKLDSNGQNLSLALSLVCQLLLRCQGSTCHVAEMWSETNAGFTNTTDKNIHELYVLYIRIIRMLHPTLFNSTYMCNNYV